MKMGKAKRTGKHRIRGIVKKNVIQQKAKKERGNHCVKTCECMQGTMPVEGV